MTRFVEVYAGAYASGKSETALNRALNFAKKGEKITLVDLDTVEPAYTLRPLESRLTQKGVDVITQPEYFGLGEAGSYVTPQQINCLTKEGNVIIDVGYGASGLDILDVLTGIEKETCLLVYLVINTAKFETCSVENVLEYIKFSQGSADKPWKSFAGFISNTHLGDETTKEDIIKGYEIVKQVSLQTLIPIRAIGVSKKLETEFSKTYDGADVWFYDRMMPKALW